MKKTTQKIAALIAAFSLTFPAYSFADDAAPEPANAPAAESAQAETAVGHRGWGRQDTPALSARHDEAGRNAEPLLSGAATLFFPLPPACGRRPALPGGGTMGGGGLSRLVGGMIPPENCL